MILFMPPGTAAKGSSTGLAFFSKSQKATVVSSVAQLKQAGVVHANFSAAQPTAKTFTLVGSIQFNPGNIEFEEGTGSFALRTGRVMAVGTGCHFDYDTIAYRAAGSETATTQVALEKTATRIRSKQASAEGRAGASLTGGLELGAKAQGRLSGEFETAFTRTETSDRPTIRQLTEAFPRSTRSEQVDEIEWVINYDEEKPLRDGDRMFDAVHGERLRKANEGAGLAFVQLSEPEGSVEIQLKVRRGDILWTDVTFDERSPLHRYGARLVNGTTKKDVIGRMALAESLTGRLSLTTLPGRPKRDGES
jgi:hypothetical protein